jgi:hypothetical protein
VIAALRARPGISALIFEDMSGRQIDFDLRDDAPAETPMRSRGRPNLGVIAREVTLLPRHWDWLAAQPGGASAALRRLVEAARKGDSGARARQEAAYHFLAAIGGNFANYEAAIRALFRADRAGLEGQMACWPADIRTHALALAYGAG